MRNGRAVAAAFGVSAAAFAFLTLSACRDGPRNTPAQLVLFPAQISLPADGRAHAVPFSAQLRSRPVALASLQFAATDVVFRDNSVEVAPNVMPGRESILLQDGPARATLTIVRMPSDADSFGDGTPDALRLHSSADRHAFRSWFTWLAELQAAKQPGEVAREIQDCAGLLRYAYREALRRHDDRWLVTQHIIATPPDASVTQWHYPETPLGDSLFRVRAGPYQPEDNAAFAQFADARALMQWNTHLISRDVQTALPGDILFYRQLDQGSPFHSQTSPFHSMIVCGDAGGWVIYHTGPIANQAGEIRRVRMRDLLQHPDARWRPVAANDNFLGVYRWNILREEE